MHTAIPRHGVGCVAPLRQRQQKKKKNGKSNLDSGEVCEVTHPEWSRRGDEPSNGTIPPCLCTFSPFLLCAFAINTRVTPCQLNVKPGRLIFTLKGLNPRSGNCPYQAGSCCSLILAQGNVCTMTFDMEVRTSGWLCFRQSYTMAWASSQQPLS